MTLTTHLDQGPPKTPPLGPEQINWTYNQVDIYRTSEKFSHTIGQEHGNMGLRTVFTPQPPTSIRDEIDYSKSYHPVKREEGNINGNFEKDIDLSEHISKRLRKMARLEGRPKTIGKVVTVGPVITLYQLHC